MKKIFIFVLFFLIFGESIRLNLGNGFVLKPLDVGVGIAASFWLITKLIKKEKVKQRYIYTPILLFAGLGFISLLINSFNLTIGQFFVSLMYLLRWIAYAGVFFIILDFNQEIKNKISKILFIIGSIIIGIGYLQYFFYSSLRNLFYLGWDEHMYRMFSVFLDPNFAGAFFVLFFLFSLNIFFKNRNIIVGLISILSLGAIFLTFSRSALIMLIISSVLMLVLLNKKIWIILLLGIIILALSISSKFFNIENINLFRIVSSEARLETAKNALLIIKNNPLIGVGYDAYRYAQFRYGLRSEINYNSHADASPDNSFLLVMSTTGLIGFCLFVFLWFRIIKLKIKNALVIASIVGIFVNCLFVNSLFYPSIMLWLWVILAL
jgi:O-antigen ligase